MSSNSTQIQGRAARDNHSDQVLQNLDPMSVSPERDARENRRILNSWKEIASYMGRGVRTVQRYEQAYGLPVRRPAGRDRTAVMALSEELDRWLSSSPTRPLGYVRPVLLLLDSRVAGALSDRRTALENAHFNVLVAASADEVLATADKFNVDGFVFDCQDQDDEELCQSLKHRFPTKPHFVMVPKSRMNGKSPRADYVIPAGDSGALVTAVLSAIGQPRAA